MSLGGASGRVLCESLQDEGVDDGTEAHEDLAGAHPGEDRGTRRLLLCRQCVSVARMLKGHCMGLNLPRETAKFGRPASRQHCQYLKISY